MLNDIVITDIRKTKKGYNALFTGDDKFLFSVDDLVLAQEKIQIGSCFSQQGLSLILEKSQVTKAVNKAYNLLSFRMHSRKELYDKLVKNFDKECANAACDKMEEMCLVSDTEYCRAKAEYLINIKKQSFQHTRLKLLTLGINKDIIDSCMQCYESSCQISNLDCLLATKYVNKLDQPQKVIAALMRKGFSYSDIKAALIRLEINTEEEFEI